MINIYLNIFFLFYKFIKIMDIYAELRNKKNQIKYILIY